jgi:ABC-2 type transport system ATP-binding protein
MARMAQANAELMVRVLRGDEPVEGDPVMVALAAARSLGVVVEDILRGLVVRARRDGRTWAEIGDVLHVTRQAVLQRFGGAPADTGSPAVPPRPMRSAGPKALELFDHFFNHRWDELRAEFNRRMLDGCSVALLSSVRAQLPGKAGEAVDMAAPQLSRMGEHTVVDVPLTFKVPLAFRRGFKREHATGRATFDETGQVAGFFILPQTTPPGDRGSEAMTPPRPRGPRWFARRQMGYGFRPATWQGWAVTAVALALAGAVLVVAHRSLWGIAVLVALLLAYQGVAALLGGLSGGGSGPGSPGPGGGSRPDAGDPAPRVPIAPPAAIEIPARTPAIGVTHRTAASSARPPALQVDHLTKRFGDRIAFEDVSFTIAPGEVFGFLGPNGAGKTTTVRTLGTLIAPTSGTAVVAGIPLTPHNGTEIRQRISIMPENPGLYLRLTVIENLELFAGLYGLRNPRPRIDRALEAVNVGPRGRDLCGSLSKGLRQRVGLARALLSDPEIMFLDEPTSGLDPVAAREVHDLINDLRRRGVTVFLTTHRLEEAERLCDRVAILNTRLRSVGRTEELRESLFSRSLVVETAAPLEAPDGVFNPSSGVDGWQSHDATHYVLNVNDPRVAAPAVTRALVAAGADVLSIAEARHSLEDVYLELIDEDPEAAPR